MADEKEIPDAWKKSALSKVDFNQFGSVLSVVKECEYKDSDFCLVDAEQDQDGIYVNLLANPERFTGYAGESALRVW